MVFLKTINYQKEFKEMGIDTLSANTSFKDDIREKSDKIILSKLLENADLLAVLKWEKDQRALVVLGLKEE